MSSSITTEQHTDEKLPSAENDPFSTPPMRSLNPSTSSIDNAPNRRRRMPSHLLSAVYDCDPGNVPKPWRTKASPRERMSYWVVYLFISIGLAIGVFQCVNTARHVELDRAPLCLVMSEDFDGTEEDVFGSGGTFVREVNMNGFGNGEFEMTTASSNNSYIENGILYIVPTLTSDEIGTNAVFNNAVYNITSCTFNETAPSNGYITDPNGELVFDTASYLSACSAVSNSTSGSIINPVQSARIHTNASIRYGKVEIRAKMPTGDWMWPALWMLPQDSVYGAWPRSGEIDLVEARGNDIAYTNRGINYVQGSLNWGPSIDLNGVGKTYSWWSDKRVGFNQGWHTYMLEWTDTFLRISVDTRLHTLLDFQFKKPFFDLGDFPQTAYNQTTGSVGPVVNPWADASTNSAPFDQEFYLIMNVAVGSTTGWFPDGQGDKPWLNNGANPMRQFANGQAQWYPTWPQNKEDRGMAIDYVRMWKHCGT